MGSYFEGNYSGPCYAWDKVNATIADPVNLFGSSEGGNAVAVFAEAEGQTLAAEVSVEGNSIRYRTDGGVPSATDGHLVEAGDRFTILGAHDVTEFTAIGVSGTAVLQVSYSKG